VHCFFWDVLPTLSAPRMLCLRLLWLALVSVDVLVDVMKEAGDMISFVAAVREERLRGFPGSRSMLRLDKGVGGGRSMVPLEAGLFLPPFPFFIISLIVSK
jgi:hypothetical protein